MVRRSHVFSVVLSPVFSRAGKCQIQTSLISFNFFDSIILPLFTSRMKDMAWYIGKKQEVNI